MEIPEVFYELLKKRGVAGDESIRRFLMPSLADLPHPDNMKNLKAAADLIVEYIKSGDRIVIWGDYDVDGTTATSLLVNFFRKYNVDTLWHIPSRFKEGYGLNIEWFYQNRNQLGRKFLVITVDCGISESKTIETIKAFGGTVIVTDHHTIPQEGVPDCIIVNPSQSDCGFHGEHLAGVGVAFYLIAMLRSVFRKSGVIAQSHGEEVNLKQFLPFVAVGTIADVVHLSETNRILVRGGLEEMTTTVFPGVRALVESCDIYSEISSEDIGFLVGPKINAAGRLGEGGIVVDLLTEQDVKNARRKAKKLTSLNDKRKAVCAENLELALGEVDGDCKDVGRALILCGEYHLGVAGIVASRLTESFGVPAIVLCEKATEDGNVEYTGSARSIQGINIVDCLSRVSENLERYGGHAMAAGLTVLPENYEIFRDMFLKEIEKISKDRVKLSSIHFDAEVSADVLLSSAYIEIMKLLEPYGPGNLPPVFCDPAATVCDSKRVGRSSEHLQLTVRGKYSNIKGIGFHLGGKIDQVQSNPVRKLIYAPTLNRYRGTTSWQLRIIDI